VRGGSELPGHLMLLIVQRMVFLIAVVSPQGFFDAPAAQENQALL